MIPPSITQPAVLGRAEDVEGGGERRAVRLWTGAFRRSPGQRAADALNALAGQWRVLEAFGSNDVLVNHGFPTAWGDPAFAVAILT